MCGIFASISRDAAPEPHPELLKALTRRGPDYRGTLDTDLQITGGGAVSLKFVSTVLAFRGDHIAKQPLQDPASGSFLCWNGEAWKIGDEVIDGNDGEAIIGLLGSAVHEEDILKSINNTLDVLRTIAGPFAFVYYDSINGLVYFGRDCLGRRSLLYNADDTTGTILLSSIADSASGSWHEIEADGIYVMALNTADVLSSLAALQPSSIGSKPFPTYRYSWVPSDKQERTPVSSTLFCRRASTDSRQSLSLGVLNQTVPQVPPVLDLTSSCIGELRKWMDKSLRLRILNIPDPPHEGIPAEVKLGVLFSGGLDCTVLARMAHDILPLDQPIDLLNVAFENPRVVLASKQVPKVSKKPKKQQKAKDIAAALESTTLDPATAESSHKSLSTPTKELSPYESCPDRLTGRAAVAELRTVCPGRVWRFVAVNIPYTEFLEHKPFIVSLIHPHNTEMDLSIAAALYFASRGAGLASVGTSSHTPQLETRYTTSARVLLSGLGADELFAGYTRHGTAFLRHGFKGLIEELDLDVSRLGKRNLGRDDRAISNWSREVRFPFLDEEVVRWALRAPVWKKCGFGTTDAGETSGLDAEKKALRLLAWKLGMHSVANEKKRAVSRSSRKTINLMLTIVYRFNSVRERPRWRQEGARERRLCYELGRSEDLKYRSEILR